MRIFWAMMLVLALGAAGVLASRYAKEPSTTALEPSASRAPQFMPVEPRQTPTVAGDAPVVRHEPQPTPEAEAVQITIEPTIDVVTETPSTTEPAAAVAIAPDVKSAPVEEAPTLDAMLGLSEPEIDVTTTNEEPNESPTIAKAPPVVAGEELAENVILNEEGNLVVAGRFTIPGEGTAEKPYVVSWDLLLAVQEHYRPRQGMTVIPAWIKFFEGKHVRLAGFVMPPMMGDDMREVLLMQNEWDGCCVGVPPTPYDAVEVKLTRNPRGLSQYTMNYGEITGVFKVDPFVQGEWLLGLYLMDGADLVIKGL